MELAERSRGGLAALPASSRRKPRQAASRDLGIVLLAMELAMSRVDAGLAALEAAARRPPPGPPVDSCVPHGELMARAVGGVGGDAAPDATASVDTSARGQGLAPAASDPDAAIRTEPRATRRRRVPADPAETRRSVVGPAARETGGVLELDEAAAASRAGRGMARGRDWRERWGGREG